MGQELLLKTDVIAKPSAIGKNQAIDNASGQGKDDVKPFSSALDEQLEKQTVELKKLNKESDPEQPEKVEAIKTSDSSEEELAPQDGSILPEVTDISDDVITDDVITDLLITDESEKVSSEELPIKVVDDEDKVVALLDDALIKLPTQNEKPAVKTSVQEESKPRFVAGENKTGLKTQQAPEMVKASVIDASDTEVKNSSAEKKQQAPVLRSDILNALSKKITGDVDKSADTVIKTEKVMAAELLEKPLNDVRKMAALLNQKKTESPALKVGAERNMAGLHTALSAGVLTSSATTIVQSTSVAPPVLAMQPSMQSEAWGKVLSSRVVWMAREGVQQAELRLNPANLGPVEVKLHMNNDQANVTFVAQHAATRDALEQALPRLRESFQENGMDLASADVSDQQAEQDNEEENSGHSAASSNLASNELDGDNQDDSIESAELEVGVSVFA